MIIWTMKHSTILTLGASLAFLAVAAGAFGAHALKERLTIQDMEIYQTATRYQMWHALALILCAILLALFSNGWLTAAVWCFAIGTAIFSGSLYALVLSGQRWLGAITPIGGMLLLIGWMCVIIATWVKKT
jgi:uncharacterized membrane protein YgdD (TMEM256/DUF423 family)